MANTSIGSFMKSVFPTYINKEGEIFTSLLTDEKGGGTLEAMWEAVEEERKEWRGTGSVYDQTGEELEKTLNLFSVLTQALGDTEERFLFEVALIFIRGENAVWGSVYDVQRIFRELLNNDRVWIISNSENSEESLLSDGDFEGEMWDLSGGATYEEEARFSESKGVLFTGEGKCSQEVSLESGCAYFLHFFTKGGPLSVAIQNDEGKYWTPSKDGFGTWEKAECYTSFKGNEEWENNSLMFMTESDTETESEIQPESESETKSFTITFYHDEESEEDTFLDFARIFEKTAASTFTLIAVFDGKYQEAYGGLAKGDEDPINDYGEGVSEEDYYNSRAYFENSYYYGPGINNVGSLYEKFFKLLIPAGVTGSYETLIRIIKDEEESESENTDEENKE